MSRLASLSMFLAFFALAAGVMSWESLDYENFQSRVSGLGDRSFTKVDGPKLKRKNNQMIVCGTHLFRAIQIACAGSFGKRSSDMYENDIANVPIFDRFRHTLLLRNMYKRGGASDACCNQPCSYSDLLAFF
eukprot:TRINITY_DN12061_c0_g1_i1.p1 TRINITY_DN12061_c0_g1~~TRINITY_DN12061_c0_g1_i1.p1  ORF type:complete len:132 (+),score=1.06 TRINITY_DN12061_c0_g1_i1:187-582(+)